MQRHSGLVTLSLLLASTQVFATMTPTFERGEKNIYHTSPRGLQEVCVIPAKYPGAKYSKKDKKAELELCNTSFYEVSETQVAEGKTTAALCAKTNSTNPAVNIYELNLKIGQTKADVEKSKCSGAEKLAKYKNSTSCSYTPGIVGYYHLSRILGRIGRVPVSVLRSMDIETHKVLANQGVRNTKTGELINTTWSGLLDILNTGLNSKRKDLVLTDDGQQSYGAVIVNPNKEEFYGDLFSKGTDRAIAFRDGNSLFGLVKDRRSLDQILSNRWEQSSVQKLVQMKDITEFILLDHIMDQQDRFGNIAFQPATVYFTKDKIEDQEYEVEVAHKEKEYEKDLKAGLVDQTRKPITIKSMILKDNDCSVSKTNVVKSAALLSRIAHMNPKTYKKLLKFQASLSENKKFFTANLMFTANDFDEMVANVNDAVKILKTNCQSGALKLDLDIDQYLETGRLSEGTCELTVN
jgi:hypothetical protein